MSRQTTWVALGELVGLVGILIIIASESPELAYVGGVGSEPLGLGVYAIGMMGRALAKALYVKPNIMSGKYVAAAWTLPFMAALMVGVEFTAHGYLGPIEAILVITGISAAFSLSVGSIEERDDE